MNAQQRHMPSGGLVLAALIVALVAATRLLVGSPAPSAPAHGQDAPPVTPCPPESSPDPRQAAPDRCDAQGLEVCVIDAATRAPIPNCFTAPVTTSRGVGRSQAIGRTVANGRIHIEHPPQRIRVFAPGCRSALAAASDAVHGVVTVALDRGCRVEFACRYADGSPAEGIRIDATLALPTVNVAPVGTRESTLLPAPMPLCRWSGVSDAQGCALACELGPGTYYLTAGADGILATTEKSIALEVGAGRQVPVHIERLVGFRVRSADQAIRAWRWPGDQDRYAGCGKRIQDMVEDYYRRLPTRPTAEVCDAWLPAPDLPRAGTEMRAEFLLATGWRSSLVRVDYLDRASVQDLHWQPAEPREGAELELHAPDVVGPVRLVAPSAWGGVNWVLVEHGQRLWLPYGQYHLVDAFGRQCHRDGLLDWTPGSSTVQTCDYGSMQAVDLRVLLPDGSSPRFAMVHCSWRDPGTGETVERSGTAHKGRDSFLVERSVESVEVSVGFLDGTSCRQRIDITAAGAKEVVLPYQTFQ